ncbi:translation initiation factor eIF2B subunit alpha [Ciona intestinalis]
MDGAEIVKFFTEKLENHDVSSAVAAIETLLEYLRKDTTETLSGLIDNLKKAKDILVETDCLARTSVSSGAELFLRFITLASSLENPDFQEVKRVMISRGELFLQKVCTCRSKIANLGWPFIKDGAIILTHSYSRVVASVLKQAAENKKRFTVYVTQSCPDDAGYEMAKTLRQYSIPVITILDAAAGYILEKVDVVLVGAEGVVENGGIVNKIGSYQLGLCAKALNKPLYVFAESFKFARLYPLNQHDLPDRFKYKASVLNNNNINLKEEHPIVDYTPPSLISLLITDLGVLTPSAVSDELIKLYL